MRQYGVHLRLLVTALIVLLAGVASYRARYFCTMMGRTVVECCCPTEHRLHAESGPTAQAPDCCKLLKAGKQLVATSDNASLPNLPAACLAAALAPFAQPEPGFRSVTALRSPARAPPVTGPPLFISHCALLI